MKDPRVRSSFFWPAAMLAFGLLLPTIYYVFLTSKCDYIGLNSENIFFEKIYFSIVTFSTLGYGDISPVGKVKIVAALQAISGPITVGYFIYGYGRYQQVKERRKNEEESKYVKENLELEKFDLVQYYRGDAYRTYSHLLGVFQLEFVSDFEQRYVCFLHTKTQTFNSVKTHYYDFARVDDLIRARVNKLKDNYLSDRSIRAVFRAQVLVDYHIASVQSLGMRGQQHMIADNKVGENLAAAVREGNALLARAKIIDDCEKHGDPVDDLVVSYFELLGGYLEHVVYSMKSLANAPSVYITSDPWSISVSEKDRKSYLEYFLETSQDELNIREWKAWSRGIV